MKYDVITFGSAILDVLVKSPNLRVEVAPDSETGKVLTIPHGIKGEVDELVVSSGGGGTNTAVGLARLGLQTAVVARCGWDLAGRQIRQELKAEKVDDQLLIQFEGEQTDLSTILVGPDGDRTILVCRGGTRLQKSVINFKKVNSFWFLTSSLEGNIELMAELAVFARQNHIRMVANPGKLEIREKERLLEIAQDLYGLVVNRGEAAALTGLLTHDPKVFGVLADRVPEILLVITEGDKGAYVRPAGEKPFWIEGLKVRMADGTGAGDGFCSGLVGGLAQGWELEKALQLGICNGAAVVEKMGAKTGLIRNSEVDDWLAREIKITPFENKLYSSF